LIHNLHFCNSVLYFQGIFPSCSPIAGCAGDRRPGNGMHYWSAIGLFLGNPMSPDRLFVSIIRRRDRAPKPWAPLGSTKGPRSATQHTLGQSGPPVWTGLGQSGPTVWAHSLGRTCSRARPALWRPPVRARRWGKLGCPKRVEAAAVRALAHGRRNVHSCTFSARA